MNRLIIFCLIFLLTPTLALSALGEKIESIKSEQKIFATKSHAIKTHNLFTIHELSRDGLTLSEYVAQDGTIFGVVWSGITHPDLTKILGKHLGDYQRSLKSNNPTVRQKFSTINGDDLIVEKFGHMRAVRGRAIVPSLLPAGVNLDEIK